MSRTAAPQSPTDLSEEDIHDVLRNQRRRLVIDILQESDGPVSVRELSEEIGAFESGMNPPPRKIKQSVYVSLLQTHLPKLDDLGIVDYQSEGKMVTVGGELEDVTVYMETVPKYGISRSEYYGALSLLGILTVFAAEVGVPVLASVSSVTLAYGVFFIVLASSIYHTYRQGSTVFHRLLGD